MSAKVKDIARESGVSQAVVSSVLNGRIGNVGYSKATRQRVLAAARGLNYQPAKRNSIGVISSGIGRPGQETDWVRRIAPMLGAIHAEALAEDTLVSVFGYAIDELEQMLTAGKAPRIFHRRKVDGLIVSGEWTHPLHQELDDLQLPYVLMNTSDSYTQVEDSVSFDEEFTGRQMTEHLLGLGHQRVLHVSVRWSSEHFSVPLRRQGYERAMRDAGLTPTVVEHHPDDDPTGILRDILDGPDAPTAMVAYNEKVALGCIRAMLDLGIDFDRVSLICPSWQVEEALLWAGISSVDLPAREAGRQSYRMLLRKQKTGEPLPAVSLRGRFVDRGSTRAAI